MMQENKLTEEQQLQKTYEKESREMMEKIYVGKKDNIGNTIKRIHGKYEEYAFYDTSSTTSNIDRMVFLIRGANRDRDKELEKIFFQIQDEFSNFNAVLHKTNADQSYRVRVATAISLALSETKTVSEINNLLKNITKEALDEYKQILNGRFWYWFGSLVLTIITIIVALQFYYERLSPVSLADQGLKHFVYALAFSSLGGLFAISIKLKEILIEKGNTPMIIRLKGLSIEIKNFNPAYAIYGAQRISLSILAGMIALVLVKSETIFAFLNSTNNIYTLMAICVVAGFSETLIPNALKKLEEKTEKN